MKTKCQTTQTSNDNPTHSVSFSSSADSEDSEDSDLFAGPRSSLFFDPSTGQLLSTTHRLSSMDALVNTFKPCALPPELLNMHKETGERTSKLTTNPFPSSIPTPSSIHQNINNNNNNNNNNINNNNTHSSSSSSKNHHYLNPINLNLSLRQPQPARYRSPNSLESSYPIQYSKLPIPSSSKSYSNSNHLSVPSSQSSSSSLTIHPSKLPSQLSSSQRHHSTSSKHSPPPVPAIPSIHQIVEKYSSQLNQSAIPLKSSSTLVQKSDHPPPRPSTTHQFYPRQQPRFGSFKSDHQHSKFSTSSSSSSSSSIPHPTHHNIKHSNPSKRKSRLASQTQSEPFSDNDSASSIHSLTREALKLPQLHVDKSSPPQLSLPSFHSSQLKLPLSKQKADQADSISKSSSKFSRSSTQEPVPPPPPAPPPHRSNSCSQAEADDHIAQYLRSSRLTTLIKLERQQSPMTVSLADVGSSTGHPVVVYLGLGCVRYLVGLYDELAEALGLRLICIDRWGLGKTTEVPDDQRSFTEWASVVEEVVDQLGIEKFSILAHSAGAPYALASSLRFGDRVHGSIHLLAPWVSMTAEGGMDAGAYKWLRYIPNSMIKTVQTAEWKMTGWRLGKLPKLNYPPVGFDARSSTPAPSPNQSFNQSSPIHSDSSLDPQSTKTQVPPKRSKTPTFASSRNLKNYKTKGIIPTSTATTATTNHHETNNIGTRTRSMTDDLDKVSIQSVDDLDSFIDQPDRVLIEIEKNKSLLLTSSHRSLHRKTNSKSSDDRHPKQSSTCSSTTTAATASTARRMTRKDSEESWSNLSQYIDQIGSSDSHDSHSGSVTAKPYLDLASNTSQRSNSIARSLVINEGHHHRTLEKSPTASNSTCELPQLGTNARRKTKHSTSSSINSSQNGSLQPTSREGGAVEASREGSGGGGGGGGGGARRTLGISLMRASYSESLKGGASDLITILEKDSKKKPWGFKYSEIDKPVKIWHGDKDEKINFKSSEFFLNFIRLNHIKINSKFFLVRNANHSLMTNVNVICQVFESIADEWSSSS